MKTILEIVDELNDSDLTKDWICYVGSVASEIVRIKYMNEENFYFNIFYKKVHDYEETPKTAKRTLLHVKAQRIVNKVLKS
jgi:hypothetical protein